MAPVPRNPGVYIEEVSSGVRPINGVATSITAFVGRALRGPVNTATRVQSFAEFSRLFGGLWQASTLSYAVSQYFQHGGSDALIVRVFHGDIAGSTETITLPTHSSGLVLEAASPGTWGGALRATINHLTSDTADTLLFNLRIEELDSVGGSTVVASEEFQNVSVDPLSTRFVDTVLNEQSALVNVRTAAPANESPNDGTVVAAGLISDDGNPITDAQIIGDQNARTGLYALESADLFNLLCIPPLSATADLLPATWAAAAAYCQIRRAMLIIDAPAAWTTTANTAISSAENGVNSLRGAIGNDDAVNAMVYFPRLRMTDPLSNNQLADFAPCGTVAGIIARIDAQRGVWKAPAGMAASFSGVQGFTYSMNDQQNEVLNRVGLNCLRSFPIRGHMVWGARTLAGADLLVSEWKYIPVRRLALFLEESLLRGTEWVVFEPNDEPLWAQIRLNIGAFMHNLFREGAFQGSAQRDVYFVKCDRETTTQNDMNRGIVNILVGFAPLKPAEFVLLQIQQRARQVKV